MSEGVQQVENGGALLLPSKAPEAAELVFRLGCLSARQAAMLWPEPYSGRSVRHLTGAMTEAGLFLRNRCSLRYSPGNAHLLLPAVPKRQRRRTWEDVFSLSTEGVRYVADQLEIPLTRARSRYNRSYAEGRREHAYLRNEAYALIAQAVAPLRDVHLLELEAEGGVGRKELPRHKGRRPRFVEPDGLLEILTDEAGDEAKTTTIFVESDTGTQDSMAVIAEKIEGYSEWYLNGGDGPSGELLAEPPPVLFISPTRRRSAALSLYVQRSVRERQSSFFRALHNRREADDWADGALDLFCTTSLELLRASGGWEGAFEYLCDDAPGPLV